MPRISRAAAMLLVLIAPGCAALSLFSQDHTHTHHHHYDAQSSEILSRLEAFDRRIQSLETNHQPAPAPLWMPAQ